MKVLVACEFSGIVRDAFLARGHDAWSCDVLCCAKGPTRHIRADVLTVIDRGWDLIIAHPPCTYLSYAANHVWNERGREAKRNAAMGFFLALYNAPCDRVAVENPMGYPTSVFRKPDQTINPFQFGDRKRKRICLWLRGLPLLIPTNEVSPPEPSWIHKRRDGSKKKNRYSMDALSPSPTRGQKRSVFFRGIADAMADQWGGLSK